MLSNACDFKMPGDCADPSALWLDRPSGDALIADWALSASEEKSPCMVVRIGRRRLRAARRALCTCSEGGTVTKALRHDATATSNSAPVLNDDHDQKNITRQAPLQMHAPHAARPTTTKLGYSMCGSAGRILQSAEHTRQLYIVPDSKHSLVKLLIIRDFTR